MIATTWHTYTVQVGLSLCGFVAIASGILSTPNVCDTPDLHVGIHGRG